MYEQALTDLRVAYNRKAEERDQSELADWKIEERQKFFSLLQQEGKKKLLEVGAGTGRDSKFFQDNGLEVISTDLSPEMVRLCQAKGLTAYVMDFLHLDFPAASFDAIYALNCLLHVPKSDLSAVLQSLQNLLKPFGLFYMGLYGGIEREGSWKDDQHEPKRFFSFYTDDNMQQIVKAYFELLYFQPIAVPREDNIHFQSMILRQH